MLILLHIFIWSYFLIIFFHVFVKYNSWFGNFSVISHLN